MTDSVSHRWWAINCQGTDEKTGKQCTTVLLLDYIGPITEGRMYRFHLVPNCTPFTVTCSVCAKAHTYHSGDLREVEADAPPFGYKPIADFRKALQYQKAPRFPE